VSMSTLPEMVAQEVAIWYVSPRWVASYFGVSKLRVYRAIQAGKLQATRVGGGSLVLDKRLLPDKFPR
jgi:excisionase family DNA binding protein